MSATVGAKPAMSGTLKRLEPALWGGAAVALFMAAWEWAAATGVIPVLFMSSPSRIASTTVGMLADGELLMHLQVSAIELAIGFALAIVVGVPLGVLLGWYRWFNAALGPYLAFMFVVPRVAFLPLVIIWFGIGINSKIALVFMGALFSLLLSVITGVRNLDPQLLKAARSFGASDRQLFLTIALPGSVPYIMTGLRLGAGRALISVVVAELYIASAGIGFLIGSSGLLLQTDRVFVGVLVIGLVGLVMFSALGRLERRFASWRPEAAVGGW
jgi:NitT/TauT family transport system permease protein